MITKKLLLALFVMMLPFVASAETVEIDGICYNLIAKGQVAEVVKKTSGRYSGNINIPSSVAHQGVNYGVTSIGQSAFSGCSGLTSVTIPNSVTSIGGGAFSGCSGLTSVTIPNSVTSIGQSAFYGCSGLTSITIPNGVTSISSQTFKNCSGLTSITIPNGVTSIGDFAFENCSGLTSVTIPNGMIGHYAFRACGGLTSVTILNGVTSIGGHAFLSCGRLTSITIPNSVTSIGSAAFSGSGLTSVTVPGSVTSIGSSVFQHCNCLTSVTISGSVTSIGDYAFDGCSGLTSITIPNSVTSIGDHAFSGSGLTSVTIPNGVTSIGSYAFKNCSGLTSVTIGNSVTSIKGAAFLDCKSLTSVTIPNSVTSIGSSAFNGCNSLTSVRITDIAAWCNIGFSDSFSNPLSYAHHFYLNGEEVKDLVIPNSVTSIGSYAFYGCNGLNSVTIPNSVTSIRSYAFYGCSKLSKVEIGKSVKSISAAFTNCENLSDVTCLAKTVPSTVSNAFYGSYVEYATLHVYESSIDAYKAASPWSTFKSIVAADIPMYAITYMVDGAVYKTVKYEEGDKITLEAEPTRDGYVFSGWGEIPETMPAHDVIVTGTFTVDNTKYTLTYMVDGEVYKSYQLKAGSTIIPLDEPTKEGYTFSGWSMIPEEMPAHDVTVTGTFKRIPLGKCASPTIEVKGGRIVFGCETEGVEFNYDIKSNVSLKGKGNDILVNPSISVSVYASKDGYDNSDVTTKDILLSSTGMNLDANGDGVINTADVVTIVNAIMSEH